MKFKKLRKFVACLTAVVLCVNPSAWTATPLLTGASPDGLAGFQNLESYGLSEFRMLLQGLPRELGSLAGSYLPLTVEEDVPDSSEIRLERPYVIHLQDAHANVEAQERIQSILEWLHENYAGDEELPFIVAVEGSVGEIHPEYLELFHEYPEANRAFVEDLKRKGEITGAELFLWDVYQHKKKDDRPVKMYGVETPELYRDNLYLYRSLLFESDDIESLLKPYRSLLHIALSRFLNPQLRDFLRESERTDVLPFTVLEQIQKTLGIDFLDKIEQLRFPNITRFFYLRDIEPLLDNELAEFEWRGFSRHLQKQGVDKETVEYLNELVFGDIPSSVSLRKELQQMLEKYSVESLGLKEFPHLTHWISYKLLSQEIESKGFLNELDVLESSVLNKLAESKNEQTLVSLYRNFSLLEKLLHLELTPDEYEILLSSKDQVLPSEMTGHLGKALEGEQGVDRYFESALSNQAELNSFFRKAMQFYEGAKKRDQALLTNAIGYFNLHQERLPAESALKGKPGLLVLVSGGFHSEGIARELREQKIPHVTISPRLSVQNSEDLYHSVLRRENADVSAYFSAQPLNKQEALFLKGLIETAAPVLTQTYGVDPKEIPAKIQEVMSTHPVLASKLESLIFPGEKKPSLEVSIRSADTAEGDGAADVEENAVGEVTVLTQAGGTTASYGYLAHQEDLQNAKADPSIYGSFRLSAKLSGHPEVTKKAGTAPSLVRNINGIQVTSGTLDGNTLRLFNSARTQLQGFARGGLFGGPGNVQSPLLRRPAGNLNRSDLRDIEVPENPSVGEIDLDAIQPKAALIQNIIESNDVIYVTAGVEESLKYKDYRNKFNIYLEQIGIALQNIRATEKNDGKNPAHKVIIFKTWTDVGTTEKFFDEIRYFRRPSAEEFNNDYFFDVVYQPDLTSRDTSGQTIDEQLVFGLRDYDREAEIDSRRWEPGRESRQKWEGGRRERTLQILENRYRDSFGDALSFVNVKSAEQAKDDLLLVLAAKLAHFNDLATVAESYGADLSVVAYGSGLDKRIRKLFTNPSLAFGGRLAQLLDWIYEARIERAWLQLEGKNFFSEDEKRLDPEAKKGIIRSRIRKAVSTLERMSKMDDSVHIEDILRLLPEELHYLFLLEIVRKINTDNLTAFTQKIQQVMGSDLERGSAAIVGFGYREGDNTITKSPAKKIIRQLILNGVTDIYIVDPVARNGVKDWLAKIESSPGDVEARLIKENRVVFHGLDGDALDIYEAAKKADFTVIATGSNAVLKDLDVSKLRDSLGDKPFFDGINLFGLRADGEKRYPLEDLGDVRYYSIGRPSLFRASPDDTILRDSYTIGGNVDRGIVATGLQTVEEIQEKIIDLETDPGRKTALLAQFVGSEQGMDDQATAQGLIVKDAAVIGGGYVGLTTGANLADIGHRVTVLDIPQKAQAMADLNGPQTEMPIHEPGLKEMIVRNKAAGRIYFTAEKEEYADALKKSSIIYLAVGTPQKEDGTQDPAYLISAMLGIASVINEEKKLGHTPFKTIVVKSTTTPKNLLAMVRAMEGQKLKAGEDFALVMNPEFLREGEAIKDITVDLDRTVLGFYSQMSDEAQAKAQKELLELWYPLVRRTPHTILVTDLATASLIKYASNAMLAIMITMANTMAEDVAIAGGDFKQISNSLKRDRRVGANAFLNCGPGFGGSCFPKDGRAAATLAFQRTEASLELVTYSDRMNQHYKVANLQKLIEALKQGKALSAQAALQNKTLGVWGLTFKNNTDDMRESQTAHLLAELLQINADGLRVLLDDGIFRTPDAPAKEVNVDRFLDELYKHFKGTPAFQQALLESETAPRGAADFFKKTFFQERYVDTGIVRFVDRKEEALLKEDGSPVDALIVMTDWDEYRAAPVSGIKVPLLVDTRDIFHNQAQTLVDQGVNVIAPGRPGSVPALTPRLNRSDLRVRDDVSVRKTEADFLSELADLFSSTLTTSEFRKRFGGLDVPLRADTEEALLGAYPVLSAQVKLVDNLGAPFYDAQEMMAEATLFPAWRYLQMAFVSVGDATGEGPVPALTQAREALGPYAWLLDKVEEAIEIDVRLGNETNVTTLFDVAGLLTASSENVHFTLLVPGAPAQARTYYPAAIERWKKLKLPTAKMSDQLHVVQVDSAQSIVRTLKQRWSEDSNRQYGTLEQDRDVLEALGYIPRMARLYHTRLDQSSALLITASLLKQLADQYDIVHLEDVLDKFNIQLEDLVDRVSTMIEVLNHIATQA